MSVTAGRVMVTGSGSWRGMTETQSQTRDATAASSRSGYKKGLPTVGLPQAEDSARKLWEVARRGTVAKAVFGASIGLLSITASSFRSRMAVLNGFGLIKTSGDEVGLSDLGLDLVQDFDETKRRTARRQAVLHLKAYRDVVDTFDGTELLSKERLAGKFQYEYGKSEDFASLAAEALIASLRHAEMLDVDSVVHRSGAVGSATVDERTDEPGEHVAESDGLGGSPATVVEAPDQVDDDALADELDRAFDEESPSGASGGSGGGTDAAESGQATVFGSGATLAMTLDLSRFRADEVVQILEALGLARRG